MAYTMLAMTSLAAASSEGLYVNPIKILVVVVLLILWALAVQWVDRDTDVVKTRRQQWNLITISSGLVGFLVLLVPPWSGMLMFVGLAAFLALAGGALLGYVVHRNSRVVPAARILNLNHFKRLLGGNREKKSAQSKGIRVKLANHQNNETQEPTDPEEALDFEAVQDFLFNLLWRRASDVDLIPGKDKYRLVYRIDGVATERPEGVEKEHGARIIRYMKRLAGLDVNEVRRPQVGRIKASLLADEKEPPFTEVRTSGTTVGERLRLHIPVGPLALRLTELGIAAPRLEQLGKALSKRHTGVFLVSSPPGHGMTTTQYAVLRSHDAYIQNIHTLERRPLMELDNMTQRAYDSSNGEVTYARMLQSVLRRDPDIVLVSECEDRETAQLATKVALEDRKIYMGIHAKDCFDAIGKYLSFVGDPKAAAKALIGIINQRLVRILCKDCRQAFKPDAATLKKLNLPADKIDCFYRPPAEPVVDKKGREIICQTCQGTGYYGRTGVFEILIVDESIAALIAEGAPLEKIKTQCRKNRMYYLQEEGLLKVIGGTTSMNEILRSLRSTSE